MMRKKRGYNRDTPIDLVRDYKVFAIACEGSKREPAYFSTFQHMSGKIKVDVIECLVSDEEMLSKHQNKSSPKWVLDRAVKYIEKEGLIDEDELWFVIDTDNWEEAQIRSLVDYCDDHSNWHIAISNPCFEVWLYLHKKKDFTSCNSTTCGELKNEISKLEKGGYHHYKFIPFFIEAIKNAEESDSDKSHPLPHFMSTKMYELGKSLLRVIGNRNFENFIQNKLPQIIQQNEKMTIIRKSR